MNDKNNNYMQANLGKYAEIILNDRILRERLMRALIKAKNENDGTVTIKLHNGKEITFNTI